MRSSRLSVSLVNTKQYLKKCELILIEYEKFRFLVKHEISFLQSQSTHKLFNLVPIPQNCGTFLVVITFNIYLVRSKSFEHPETYSSYEEENCDGHNDQGKYCLWVIDT